MPIRFRCAYCNQLMGIARRKSGTVVSCPTCQGQVVVPSPEPALQPVPLPPPTGQHGAGGNVFEQQDFDPGLFNPNPVQIPALHLPVPSGQQAPTVPTPAPSPPLPAGIDPQPLYVPPTSDPTALRGVLLSPAKLTMLAVAAVVVGLVLFGLGVVLGRSI